MLPGKKFTPEEIARILWRRKWLLVVPFAVGIAASVIVAKRLPNRYKSETLIMLIPQRIPDSYVKNTVTGKIEDRLPGLSQQILSRSRLERIITDLDLYPDQRRSGLMEDIVDRMRHDVDVQMEKADSFRVSYVSRDAKTSQKVTERLASLFIEENLRDRENLAEDTNQFLESQLEDARQRLIEQEKKLEEYRRRFSGQLPTQAASNLQAIQSIQIQLQSLGESVDRIRERRLNFERQLTDVQLPDPTTVITSPPAANQADSGVSSETTAQQLETAKARLRILQMRDKPDHPDVRAMQRTIRNLEVTLQQETSAVPSESANAPRLLTPTEIARDKRRKDLTAQIAGIDRELQEKQDQERRLRASIEDYQTKLDAVPKRESELVELTRDYTTLQNSYQTLLAKREESKIAANLERRNIGEQFRVLDPARASERPVSPDRQRIAMLGSVAGLFVGLALVGFLEYRDSTFKVEDEVVRLLALPVLAVVPTMTSAVERQADRRRTLIVVATTVVVLLGSAGLVLWRLQS